MPSSSASTSASHSKWPRYGPVPLGKCPDCPRTAPLKRRITTSDRNGNAGREYVKCESRPELGKDLPTCEHFEWLDVYIKRIEKEGTSLGLNLPSAAEQFGSATGVATVQNVDGLEEVKAELKKMNKQLKNLVDLKKQDKLMAAIFYLCAIVLGVVYVLIISH